MKTNFLLRPFEVIAGWKALIWGLLGIAVGIVTSYFSGYHYHGLLHYGPAPNDALWYHIAEHLIVWLVPAILFYIGGLILSKSKIRPVDVFGTVAFAQIPLTLMSFFYFLPPFKILLGIDYNTQIGDIMLSPAMHKAMLLSILLIVFITFMLIWMYNAFKVSCNLKGAKLNVCYIIAIVGGDILSRLLISTIH